MTEKDDQPWAGERAEVLPSPYGSLTVRRHELTDRAESWARGARADTTWMAYDRQCRRVPGWCDELGECPLPADPLTVARFLADPAPAWRAATPRTSVPVTRTAVLLHRGDRRAALPAAAGSALLAIDAWMDVTTSGAGTARMVAIVKAAALEVPLAVTALVVAVRLLASDRSAHSYPPPTRTTSALHP